MLYEYNKPTKVYWNLHRKCWSVVQDGRVVAHAAILCLSDVDFRVQPAGRERVRREGRKNVHAYAKGKGIVCPPDGFRKRDRVKVTYNPYINETFVTDSGPIHKASLVWFNKDRTVECIV